MSSTAKAIFAGVAVFYLYLLVGLWLLAIPYLLGLVALGFAISYFRHYGGEYRRLSSEKRRITIDDGARRGGEKVVS